MSKNAEEKPILLLVADREENLDEVVRYAVKNAKIKDAVVGIASIYHQEDFQHWGNVQDKIQKELRDKAELEAWKLAAKIKEYYDCPCAFFVEQGVKHEVLLRIINENENIRRLILGASTKSAGPGPLVSFMTGKGISQVGVPIIIVPENVHIREV